jgi:hypothetical protein
MPWKNPEDPRIRESMAAAQKRYRAAHPERIAAYKAKTRDRQLELATARRRTRREQINEIKLEMGGCIDCGYTENVAALDFDHREGEVKVFTIGKNASRPWKAILAEIAKCDVRCANCHRVRTIGTPEKRVAHGIISIPRNRR